MELTTLELDAEIVEALPEREVMLTFNFGLISQIGAATAVANQTNFLQIGVSNVNVAAASVTNVVQ